MLVVVGCGWGAVWGCRAWIRGGWGRNRGLWRGVRCGCGGVVGGSDVWDVAGEMWEVARKRWEVSGLEWEVALLKSVFANISKTNHPIWKMDTVLESWDFFLFFRVVTRPIWIILKMTFLTFWPRSDLDFANISTTNHPILKMNTVLESWTFSYF